MIPYDQMRSALHLAVYIRELGAEPPPLTKLDWAKWASAIHKQFDHLRKVRGTKKTRAACLRGRSIIAQKGLFPQRRLHSRPRSRESGCAACIAANGAGLPRMLP
jgi:hypothetical protein